MPLVSCPLLTTDQRQGKITSGKDSLPEVMDMKAVKELLLTASVTRKGQVTLPKAA